MTEEEFNKQEYILSVAFTIKEWEDIILYLPEKYKDIFNCQLNEVANHNFYIDD